MRLTNDLDGKILNIEQHRHLYKMTYRGDLFLCKRGELGRGWKDMESDTMRRHVWEKFRSLGMRGIWHEQNGVAIKIDGFRPVMQGIGDMVWVHWVCEACDSVYEDSPREVDYLRSNGCRNGSCVTYEARMKLLQSLTDEDLES